MTRTVRQAQQPFSGQVAPPGDVLFFQEEFQSGERGLPFHPIVGPGSQPFPARWLDWTPVGVDPADVVRWIDVLQQRASITTPVPGAEGYQWAGSVVRLPSIERFPFEPIDPNNPAGTAICFLDVYSDSGIGPGLLGDSFDDVQDAMHGVIVSATDLSLAGDNQFFACGIHHEKAVFSDSWISRASWSEWTDSQSLFAEDVRRIQATGALFRIFMQILRQPGSPPTYETELSAAFSTDHGASWVALGFGELKGDGYPKVIGLGATGRRVAIDNLAIIGTGGFSSIRIFPRSFTTPALELAYALVGLSPEGGRNW